MKKLEKLNANKLANTEQVKGGAGIFVDFSVDVVDGGSVPTTEHRPTKGRFAEHYTCDHAPDTK